MAQDNQVRGFVPVVNDSRVETELEKEIHPHVRKGI